MHQRKTKHFIAKLLAQPFMVLQVFLKSMLLTIFIDDATGSEDDEYEIRNEQVHWRACEVSRMMDLMVKIDEGKPVKNVATEAREDAPASDGDGSNEEVSCLQKFRGRLDLKDVALIGHSFGGATSLLTLSRDHR